MTADSAKPPSRRLWKYLAVIVFLAIAVLGTLAWYATTNSFQTMVRKRLVAELERITGGRVMVGSVHAVPFRFQIDVRDLTIHGLEGDAEIPYAHVDRLMVRLKLTSILTSGLAFRSVVFEHPTIHLIVYPDGTTNQPAPRREVHSANTAVENLFALSISQLEVRNGELLFGDRRIPLDFSVNSVFADMTYSLLHGRYEASLLLGKAVTRYGSLAPVAWTGAAHFRLSQSSIQVESLQVTSGHSRIQASGILLSFVKPSVTGTYDALIDLHEASMAAGLRELRSGIIETSGKGTWNTGDFSAVGKLQGKDLDWRDGSLNIRDASLGTGYSIDSKRISLPDIVAHVLGGSVAGNAEITEWQPTKTPRRAPREARPAEQNSAIHLKFRDLSAFEISNFLSTPQRPFGKMNLAGSVAGTVDGGWKGSPANAVADVVLDVVSPANLKPGQLGLNAHARTTYRRASDEIEVSEFIASTQATLVRASGVLSSSSSVKLSVTTSNLGEWQPVLIAAGYDQPVPVKLLGPASFNGTATGHISSITFSGKLESGNFDFVVPATSRTPEEDVHWDSFVTNLRISPAGLALRDSVLRRNNTGINFDLNLGLQDREFTPSSPFTARITLRQADVAELLSMAGYHYPATGTVNLSAQLSGTRSDPEGDGNIQISAATIHGQPIQRLNATLSFSKGDLVLQNIEMAQGAARVTGNASYTFSSHAFTSDLSGAHFDLAPMLQTGPIAVDGQLDFVAHASGTLDNPTINAKIHLQDLTFDKELAGDFTLNAVSQGGMLNVSGASQFKTANLSLMGNIQPSGNWPASLDLHFTHLDVDSVLRTFLHGRVTGHSAVAGDLHISGPLRHASELALSGNLSDMSAEIENVKLHNDGPFRFSISNHVFKVEHFHLLGDNTDLSGDGSVNLAGNRDIDFRARGKLNLQLVQSYDPDFTSTGNVDVDMTVAGTVANPVAQGRVQITDGSVAYVDSPSALSGVNGSLTFSQNRFEVEKLTGHVGGGTVAFDGHASLNNGQVNFDLGLHGDGVRLRYPAGVSSTANLDLRFAGSSAASTVTGDITITKVAVTPGFDFGAYLQRTAQSAAISQTNPVLNRIRLDVHIVTMSELQMQTAVIRLSGAADLRLRGTAAKSVLLGRADVLEGQAYFNGTKYRLERGDVTFNNPVTTVPVVDLQASTHVRDYDITLNLNGPSDKLNLTYRSEPPLPTADIIAFWLLARPRNNPLNSSRTALPQSTRMHPTRSSPPP